jgi:hypothetical protein
MFVDLAKVINPMKRGVGNSAQRWPESRRFFGIPGLVNRRCVVVKYCKISDIGQPLEVGVVLLQSCCGGDAFSQHA